MKFESSLLLLSLILSEIAVANAFVSNCHQCSRAALASRRSRIHAGENGGDASDDDDGGDNKAMAFLRKIGRVGGVSNIDFKTAVGVDEGPAGKAKGGSTKVSSCRRCERPIIYHRSSLGHLTWSDRCRHEKHEVPKRLEVPCS